MVEPGEMENPMQGVDEVEPALAKLQSYFRSGKTRDPAWRK